eukprot:scaffold306764_cov21-Tisochrysis_lutea.AAC.2
MQEKSNRVHTNEKCSRANCAAMYSRPSTAMCQRAAHSKAQKGNARKSAATYSRASTAMCKRAAHSKAQQCTVGQAQQCTAGQAQ